MSSPRTRVVVHLPWASPRSALLAALLIALLIGLPAACMHDVGDAVASNVARAVPAPATDALLGLDPGFLPTQPLRQLAVAGASLPRSGGSDLNIAFVAFVTSAAADDADGNGAPLDRTAPAPADGNGADDVFVAAMVNTERSIAGQAVPAAFTQGLAPIFHDQRCVRCHSFHYPGGWRQDGHIGALPAGSNQGCADCHQNADILVPGLAPASVAWIAPDVDQTIQPTQDFRGKSDRELFDLVLTKADPKAHLQTDDRILWAIGHGRVPFQGVADGGPVPCSPQHWQNLVEGWAQAGMQFSTTAAVQDIVLASRRSNVAAAGDGASSQPSLAFVANPGYSPADPTAAALGTVYVAFASTSTDLLATAASTGNVYRSTIEVWLSSAGEIDLRFVDGGTAAVSTEVGGGLATDGDSSSPAMDADGNLIAFASTATNLVSGFTAGPAGVSNVFVRDMNSGVTALQSHATGGVAVSGDGDSTAPAISQTGGIVAFGSAATNLVDGDGNGVDDVFVTGINGGTGVLRASVGNGGAEAQGGASSHAAVWRDAAGNDAWVAFESTADLGFGTAAPSVLLHHPSTGATIVVGAGTGPVRQPAFAPDGSRLWLSTANALDSVRVDRNGLDDVVALDFAGLRSGAAARFERATIAATGNDADGVSSAAAVGGFRLQDGSFGSDQLLAFQTTASNLGRSPATDVVVDFGVDRSIPRVNAEFTSAVTRGVAPFAVQFTDLSNNATSWLWDFGDGGAATTQHPSHVYAAAGTYTVSLTVSGTIGSATMTKPAFVQATAAPLAWSTIYANESLAANCAGCHTGSSSVLFSMTTANNAYDNLVGIDSALGCMPPKRVLAGDSANSGLMFAISTPPQCVSFRMGSLGPQALHDIVDWIDHGVPR